jgi:hypothetical protein
MDNSVHWRSGHRLHGARSFSRSHQSLSYSEISKQFMEPSSDPYPKPDESSLYLPILFL